MPVPSNWYVQGLDVSGVVWFARSLHVPASNLRKSIEFAGVDYACEVYLDGEKVGEHRGYFSPFRIDLPRGLSGPHLLAVRVDSPRELAGNWSLRKTLIKGVLAHHDTRPGNAWSPLGQDANTGGMWGSVTLASAAHTFFDDVRIATTRLERTKAELTISGTLDTRARGMQVRYTVRDRRGAVVARGLCELRDGELSASFSLRRPDLWWPKELGEPNLYSVTLSAGPAGGLKDLATFSFGVRTVARSATNQFTVNGRSVFLRGTNYIPGQYLASLTREALSGDLDMMAEAHINAIRVHAHVTTPLFYTLADERGFLVWQDAPLQWGYSDSDAFAVEAASQVSRMVSLLYNHPSVFFWAGMNEAPFSSDWMHWKYPDYDPDQNRKLERAVRAALERADISRPFESNSHPSEHAWHGWYAGTYKEFARPTPHSVITEFGAQAVPEVATLRTFLRADQLWPIVGKNLETWEYHDFQLRELRDIAKVPLGARVEDLVRNSQAYQARLTQFAVENLRRQKWQPVTAIFQFMFVEHWASMNWGVVDYLKRPKAGYQALARAYQPVLPIAFSVPQGALGVSIINDGQEPVDGCTLVVRRGPKGDDAPQRIAVDLPANDILDVEVDFPLPGLGERLTLDIERRDGQVISRNAYDPGYFQP